MATKHTHGSIKSFEVRLLLARDIFALRRQMRRCGESMKSDWVQGIRLGLDTMARRMEDWQRIGPEYLTDKYCQVRR